MFEGLRNATLFLFTKLFPMPSSPARTPREQVQIALPHAGKAICLVERMRGMAHALRTLRLDSNQSLVLTGQGMPRLVVLPAEGRERRGCGPSGFAEEVVEAMMSCRQSRGSRPSWCSKQSRKSSFELAPKRARRECAGPPPQKNRPLKPKTLRP